MKTGILRFYCLLLLLTCARGQTVAPAAHPGTPAQKASIVEGYGRFPLAFEANQGQTDPQVKFVSRGAGYNLFLTTTEAVLTLHKASRQEPNSPTAKALPPQAEKSAVLHMKLVGANAKTEVSGQNELASKSNYFIGNDPKKWYTSVPQYARVRYADVYPGVDLVYYGNQRELEYDFVVRPGIDPQTIRLGIDGTSKLRLDRGDLVLSGSGGDVHLRRPHIYQQLNRTRQEIRGSYVIKNKNEVGFRIANYDSRQPLVIDPVLAYSTYLGGSGDEAAMDIAVDTSGNAYVTGYTASLDFPVADAMQPANNGGHDAFVTKINANGSALIFSTYLGGSGDDVTFGIAVGPANNVYVSGATTSTDFPTANAIQPTNHGSWDAFVTKISADGNALLYSTYLGGSGDEAYGQSGKMAVDSAGNAYLTGWTSSGDFPTLNAVQPVYGGGTDAFVTKMSADGSALIYSTYLGGSSLDAGHAITADSAGNAYLTGQTRSPDFPVVNPIQPSIKGPNDIFVTKIKSDGSALVFSTYLGGSGFEWGQGIRVDSAGNVYVGGNTGSTDFPTVNAIQPTAGGNGDGFALKIKADGSALIYSTYLGGSENDADSALAIDSEGNTYLFGVTGSSNFPTVSPIQPTKGGGDDAFVSKLNADGSALVFSTYLGGSNNENGWTWNIPWGRGGVAVDQAGSVYVSGYTESTDFPITPLAFQQSSKGGLDAFVAKITFGEETTTTLTSSLNPSNYGQKVTFTATVSAASGTPTGTVIFYDGSTQLGSGTLTNGSASISTSSLSAGSHSITAAYQGSGSFRPSTSAPLNQVVNGVTTTTTLVSTLNPSVFGQAVTFTAAVSAASGTPTGTVIFYDGSTMIGSATLASGSASISIASLAAGSHSITAAYQGSGGFEPSTSSPLNQVVNPAATTTSLVSSVNPARVKQSVTYTATVASQYGGAATGTVTFQDGGATIATVTLSGNQAAYSTSYPTAGVHSITATYSGDANNAGSVSSVLEERIGNAQPSKTTLATSGSPSFVGQPVTFTATVTSTHGAIPDGELVTFYDGTTTLGSVALASGTAAYTTSSLSGKTHTIKATYAGDANFKPSTGAVTQVVSKYPTTTALSSSLNPSNYGQAVTFTTTVTPSGPYPPTGKVKFMDGTVGIGTATLSGGVAQLTKSKLAVGTHPITAQYLGDAASDKSTSPVVNQVVQ